MEQLIKYVIYASVAGIGFSLMMYVAAKVGSRSTRTAGIVGGLCAGLYVILGVGGAMVYEPTAATKGDDDGKKKSWGKKKWPVKKKWSGKKWQPKKKWSPKKKGWGWKLWKW